MNQILIHGLNLLNEFISIVFQALRHTLHALKRQDNVDETN
jgi:hypothetical protein